MEAGIKNKGSLNDARRDESVMDDTDTDKGMEDAGSRKKETVNEFTSREHFAEIRSFSFRPSDIIVASYPKCGLYSTFWSIKTLVKRNQCTCWVTGNC